MPILWSSDSTCFINPSLPRDSPQMNNRTPNRTSSASASASSSLKTSYDALRVDHCTQLPHSLLVRILHFRIVLETIVRIKKCLRVVFFVVVVGRQDAILDEFRFVSVEVESLGRSEVSSDYMVFPFIFELKNIFSFLIMIFFSCGCVLDHWRTFKL